MSFEVTFDPNVWARGHGMIFDPERHERLPDGEWVRWIRRRLDLDYLFVYHHRLEGKFVLAAWLVDPSEPSGLGGVASELATMSAPPDRHPHDLPETEYLVMVTAHSRDRAAQAMSEIRGKARDRNRKRIDDAREKGSLAKFMKSHGREMEAWMVESGQTPFSVDKRLTEPIADELNTLSKMSSRSPGPRGS